MGEPGFTFNGLRKLGVDEDLLQLFLKHSARGWLARAKMIGDTGANHPENWEDNIASPNLHAVVILFARDKKELNRCLSTHQKYIDQNPGVEILSSLLLEAVPPFDYVSRTLRIS